MNTSGNDAGCRHVSVLPVEVVQGLDPQPGQTLVDCTVGTGGHTRLLAERVGPTGRVLGLDHDPAMLDRAREKLVHLPVTLIHANFDQLASILEREKIGPVDGVLADLGICSEQLDDPERGFSFTRPGPLDMRMDPRIGEPARLLLRRVNERELADLIWRYGEERFSRRVAKRIVETRGKEPLETTQQLADLVRRCVPRSPGHGIDPATRVFQALRIAVNDELGVLEQLLRDLPQVVKPGGRAAIISFHSLEDRLVKEAFRRTEYWEALTKKPIQASDDEVRQNPRARSAKLRVARRCAAKEIDSSRK